METDSEFLLKAIKRECRKIYFVACLQAIIFGAIVKMALQNVLVVLLNIHIFHPMQTVIDTTGIFFSFYWFRVVPAMLALLAYGFIFCKNMLRVKKFYATRFQWLIGCGLRKLLFSGSHALFGLLVAFASIGLMPPDYRSLYIERYGVSCLNDRVIFLLGVGISAGSLYFLENFLQKDADVEFPIIEQCKLVAARNAVLNTANKALFVATPPLFAYVVLFWLFGGALDSRLSKFLRVSNDDSLDSILHILTDLPLLFYAWLIWTQVWCTLRLMQCAFNIFLSQSQQFVIERSQAPLECYFEVTLVDALSFYDIAIIQHLAALDLCNIGSTRMQKNRQQIYQLSVPGNHPYNWNQLTDQCLLLITTFIEELADSVQSLSNLKPTGMYAYLQPSFTDNAERALIRQYNEAFHIRRLMSEPPMQIDQNDTCSPHFDRKQNVTYASRILELKKNIKARCKAIATGIVESVPGIRYMFGEAELAKTAFVLNNSQIIIWIAHGLTTICVLSIHEDQYGVVQLRLAEIIKTLLRLKLELDKLNSINLNGKKFDQNLNVLRGAILRNIFQISNVFGDYFRDIIDDPEDLRNLQSFLCHRNRNYS